MEPWLVTDDEWEGLGDLLASEPHEGAGRPRLNNDRACAQACLYRHFHANAERYRAFGWHQLPDFLGVSPNTANRRFRAWTDSGAWLRFWDGLQSLRQRRSDAALTKGRFGDQAPAPRRPSGVFPAGDLIAELERAYLFFNQHFFGNALPAAAITLERSRRRRCLGYFCARLWHDGERELGHIAVHTQVLDGTPAPPLAVLLHEMIHLRNDHAGIDDTHPRTQYHNRHFRDLAVLCGLECEDRHPAFGYAFTHLDDRGEAAVAALQPDFTVFRWIITS